MEFALQTDLAVLPQSIEFNFDVLKSELSQKLERYNNLVVTEDSIRSAKDDRADLNRLKGDVDQARKSVKKTYMAPYDAFEARVKELTAMIQQPIDAIDTQVKIFDDQEKKDKYRVIEQFYRNNIGSLIDFVPIDMVLNPKWGNKTVQVQTVQRDMIDSITRIKNDIGIIQAMRLSCEQQVLDVYLRTQDMSAALSEKNRIEEQAAKLKALEAEKKAAEQATPATQTSAPQGEVIPFATPAPVATHIPQPVEARDFRVFVTPEQRAALARFLKENGIKYEFIPVDNEGRIIPWQQSRTA